MFAQKWLGIRYSISLYGIEAIKINQLIYRKAVCCANQIIVISEYTKELVRNQFQFELEKFFMLISSVDENRFYLLPNRKSLKSKYGLEGSPVVLTLSRLSSSEEKGQHRVLVAMREVLKKFPNAKYVVAGPGNDDRLDQVLSEHPELKHSFVRIGLVSELQKLELYNLCDVFILPLKTRDSELYLLRR